MQQPSQIEFQSALLKYRTLATIHEDVRGGPVRRIGNGRHRKPVGRYISRKARRGLPWEDRTERKFFWLCEADTDVVTYLAQPHCLEIHLQDGTSLEYYPDVRRDMADRTVQIRELKSEAALRRGLDPKYELKLGLAAEIYAGLGWDFALLGEADIESPKVRLETAYEIQRRRHVFLSPRDRFAIIGAVHARGGVVTLGELCAVLGGEPLGTAKAYAAIVARIVHVRLDLRLSEETKVTIARGAH